MLEEYKRINDRLPVLFEQLLESPRYSFGLITKGYLQSVLGSKEPVKGIYLISDKEDNPLYVGRSKTLAQRLGVDHRATNETRANLTLKLSKIMGMDMNMTREYMYDNFYVRVIKVEHTIERTLLEIYAAMILNTPHNSFEET
jgi:hypothetical protein